MRKVLLLAGLLLSVSLFAGSGTKEKGKRMGESFLFMPKGTISLGLQGSYFDITGSNSTVMLLLQELNASGSYFGISPYFSYCYRDNRAVGLKIKYSSASGGLAKMDLNVPGLEMDLGLSNLGAESVSFTAEVFRRSYWGLDRLSRFGLFLDTALQYRSSTTSLAFGAAPDGDLTGTEALPGPVLTRSGGDSGAGPSSPGAEKDYTRSLGCRLLVRAGLEIFVMNNVSSTVSIGIGGLSYTNSRNFSGGQVTGTKNSSSARFMPDITDISMGVAVHF